MAFTTTGPCPQVVYVCKSPEDFGLCVEWNRFRENCYVLAETDQQLELAKANGLGTWAPPGVKGASDFSVTKVSDSILSDEKTVLKLSASLSIPMGFKGVIWFEGKNLASETRPLGPNSRIATPGHGGDFQVLEFVPPPELVVGRFLRINKYRVSVLEATTGGLVAASLLAVPGASSFFISGATVYTGRGAKRILPESVLQASALFDRDFNYKNRENYVLSKRRYCEAVSKAMRIAMKADFCIVESGTAGPDFYISGVQAFTAVGIAGPNDFCLVDIFDSPTRDRRQNMRDFTDFALRTTSRALEAYALQYNLAKI